MHKKTSIVFVAPSLKTGGGNRVFIELANELAKDNYLKISIIAPNNSDENHTFLLSNKVFIHSIGNLAKGKISKIVNILKTIKYLNTHNKQLVVMR